MSNTTQCKQCGAELVAGPAGLSCPRCLLKIAMEPNATNAPSIPPSEIERLIPGIKIERWVGEGGMGTVYKGIQTKLDRPVAIKILSPAVSGDPEFVERFTREARALARLNHGNIVNVYDFGEAGGFCYLMMEFVDGLNLRQLLNSQKLTAAQALAIVPQICDALQFAHEKGVVHRDIKPENILIDTVGRAKVADFGLAKLVNSNEPNSLTLTGSQQVLGSINYMAPEQRERSGEVDHRADIYSLGVVFYEMLTGELPIGRFAAPSKKIQIDARLDEVVFRALEKEPELRYQKAVEIKTSVEQIAQSPPPPKATINPNVPPPPPVPPRHRRREYNTKEKPRKPPKYYLSHIVVCAAGLIVSGFFEWMSFDAGFGPNTLRASANGWNTRYSYRSASPTSIFSFHLDTSYAILIALMAMGFTIWKILGGFNVRFIIPISYIVSLVIITFFIPVSFSTEGGGPSIGLLLGFTFVLAAYITYYHIYKSLKAADASTVV